MNVYKVSTYAKPPGSRFKYYAVVDWKDSDSPRLDCDMFNGRPYSQKWRSVKLFFVKPNWPRADFYNCSIGKFVCNEKARRLCAPALEVDGEFLPVAIQGEREPHFIYNVIRSGEYLDPGKSIWEYNERRKERDHLEVPAFFPRRLKKHKVVKIPEDYFCGIYAIERTGDGSDCEFKALVEQHKLTGLKFDLVWNDQSGPVKPRDHLITRQYKLRTGDGKLVR